MATIQCKECGKRISSNADRCPNCGEPVQKKSFIIKVMFFIAIILYILAFMSWSSKSGKHNEFGKTQQTSNKQKEELRKTLKGGYFACTSESLFGEMTSAIVQKDNLAIGHLLSSGCVLTKPGVRISYIESPSFGVAKVRAYSGDNSIILYTNYENVHY